MEIKPKDLVVFVRSSGERTEQLCITAISKEISPNNIHQLKGITPSLKTYQEMFDQARCLPNPWFMGVDADVVLNKGWAQKICQKINQLNKSTFKFTYKMYDPLLESTVDRGNHVYNNKYSQFALDELQLIGRMNSYPLFFKKLFKIKKGYYLKPETSIRTLLRKKHALKNYNYPDIIGIHGAEQSYEEIFRSYAQRVQRNPEFEHTYPFLLASKQNYLYKHKQIERLVANLGWEWGKTHHLNQVDLSAYNAFEAVSRPFNLKKQPKLNLSLETFYKRYTYTTNK